MNAAQEIAAGAAFIAGLPQVKRQHLIGSAAFLPETAADVDFAVFVEPSRFSSTVNSTVQTLMAEHGFEACGEYDTSGASAWTAVRRGHLNLMVTNDEAWFERYVTAMEVCKFLKVANKQQRIGVCQIVRDGRPADEVLQLSEDLFA